MVKIEGLTKNQKIIADFMWNKCETQRDVEAVLHHYGHDARIVYELLTATALDQYMEVDEARVILQRFQ